LTRFALDFICPPPGDFVAAWRQLAPDMPPTCP
jgi:hypothetical protein